ncbi:hypothetical protein tinsulaeT_38560 [Thalassotalea insulae]|uniref:histidine kinase n=1 Tax=Thalassotalea insulae TaxID=2056778 RepID=A0ABQ6GX52_9GAMM|nr:HAMP domain-containing sensor histidine kinase [Thalassotalea insulae]GLX80516.1 hypothetical protein tinsulaeT_38560 [Thalassotalea insulae]
MSLRNYLFILIGCLICFITIIQLVIINWIENNLASEVDQKARLYSKQVIELAVEKLTENEAAIFPPSIEKNNTQPATKVKIITLDGETEKNLQHLPNSHSETILTQHLNKVKLKKEFNVLIEQLHQETVKQVKNDNQQTIVVKPPRVFSHTKVKPYSSTKSDKLFQYIELTLVIVGILGLIFAYWLSIQFNKPLKTLSHAFHRLAKGDYQYQVKEQGVKEIRQTIQQFNQMVTRLKQLSETEQQHQEIQHLAELGEVSRGLAHALRNPIHTIGLSIEQLNDEQLSDQQKRQLITTIQHKIANVDKSIKALLTLTTMGICRNERIPLLAVIQDIILEYKSSGNKVINFTLEINTDIKIVGAESEVRSIIHTLIYNACEASAPETTVMIQASENEQQQTTLIIKDQGSGLAPHIKSQLFQPHVSSKSEGAGMGLYIAQRLITLHYHGSITLSNIVEQQQVIGCQATVVFGANNE